MSSELDELEALMGQAEQSAEEFVAETRGGAGTPAERRMADAFGDFNKTLRALARCIDGIEQEQRETRVSLDRVASMPRELERTVDGATERYMSAYGKQLDQLKEKGDATISALGSLDATAADEYKAAVSKSTKLLARFTAGAAAAIVLLAVAGGLWALVGASWFVRMSPEIQAWVTSTPGLVAGIVLPVVIFGAGFYLGKDR